MSQRVLPGGSDRRRSLEPHVSSHTLGSPRKRSGSVSSTADRFSGRAWCGRHEVPARGDG